MKSPFVPFPRDIENTPVFKNDALLRIFTWCMYRATFREIWVSVVIGRGTADVHLRPGQFIFGRNAAAIELQMSASTVWQRMQKLESLGILNINSNRHYSIVTVVNLATCDDGSEKSDSQGGSQGEKPAAKPAAKQAKKSSKKSAAIPDSANDDFTKFWAAYPRREKKVATEKIFLKLAGDGTLPPIDVLLAAISTRRATPDWTRDKGQYIPLPTSWLNDRRWDDEISGNGHNNGAAKQSQSSLFDKANAAWEAANN